MIEAAEQAALFDAQTGHYRVVLSILLEGAVAACTPLVRGPRDPRHKYYGEVDPRFFPAARYSQRKPEIPASIEAKRIPVFVISRSWSCKEKPSYAMNIDMVKPMPLHLCRASRGAMYSFPICFFIKGAIVKMKCNQTRSL